MQCSFISHFFRTLFGIIVSNNNENKNVYIFIHIILIYYRILPTNFELKLYENVQSLYV